MTLALYVGYIVAIFGVRDCLLEESILFCTSNLGKL